MLRKSLRKLLTLILAVVIGLLLLRWLQKPPSLTYQGCHDTPLASCYDTET